MATPIPDTGCLRDLAALKVLVRDELPARVAEEAPFLEPCSTTR